MKTSFLNDDLSTLEKTNMEQKRIIQILCDAYNSPNKNNLNIFSIFINTSKYISAHKNNEVSSISDDRKRLDELEKSIKEQEIAQKKIEKQLIEYNVKAQEFESELAKNEREKAKLLASFQQSSNTNTNTYNMSDNFKELEKKAQVLTEECNKNQAKSENAKALYDEILDQLLQSQSQVKILEKQVHEAKNQLSISGNGNQNLLNQIGEQELLIENLTVELSKTNDKIAQLKRENQSLRDKLINTDDSN